MKCYDKFEDELWIVFDKRGLTFSPGFHKSIISLFDLYTGTFLFMKLDRIERHHILTRQATAERERYTKRGFSLKLQVVKPENVVN